MTTYMSEPGTRLGGRYRLEDRIAAGSGWAAWKAIDETLARAVTVFTFAQGFPRIAEVVTAARAASRLTDPRLAQVFDVEDAWDRAYIVMEWAAGETLDDLLSSGPLEPNRGARMIAEAAAALASAHAAGVAHMCLSPGSVRWSPTGEVKVVGLGIDAALAGLTSEDPVLTDTTGLGKLLYAALTGCWPGNDCPSLPPAPVADGEPRSPRQVAAGIPMIFSDLACRALQLSSREGSPAITTPGEFSKALFAAIPPAPVPSAPPPPVYRSNPSDFAVDPDDDPYWPGRKRNRDADVGTAAGGWRDYDRGPSTGWPGDDRYAATDYGRGPAGGYGGQPPRDGTAMYGNGDYAAADPYAAGAGAYANGQADLGRPGERAPGHRSNYGKRGPRSLPLIGSTKIPVRILAAAGALVLVAVVATVTFWPSSGPKPLTGSHASSGPTTPVTSSVTALQPVKATGFDPLNLADQNNENSQYAANAIDKSSRSFWASQWYKSSEFGGLKTGAGLLIEMAKPVTFRSVVVTFGTVPPGSDVKLLVGNSDERSQANLSSMTTVASANGASGKVTFRVTSSVKGRFLVIWFTKLPPKSGSGQWYMAQVFNVVVHGIG
jgi:eukaryotic-like serine/threonine-protein kinase